MIQVPEHIRRLIPYVPGKPIEELEREFRLRNSIKLASNENPLGPSPRALEAVQGALAGIHRYPDGNGYYLKEALAERHGLSPEQIILGNGSNQILDLIVRTFFRPGMNAVTSERTFVVYPMAMQAVGGECRAAAMNKETYDLDAMADLVDGETLCVFIANPNNPTGTVIHRKSFEAFMERLSSSVLVVMDEAYFEYVEDPESPDGLEYLKAGKDVIVLRTFSKIYGLAGLRIGYGMADPKIIEAMNRVREPFNTNTLAQAAALSAIGDEAHVRESLEVNREGKAFLYEAFERMGLPYTPTQANFIWVETPVPSREIYDALLSKGVIVRVMGERHLRITIGLPRENQRLAGALEKVIGGRI
ncbi:MAG: histidinol-phosphate transaminase [Nitrospirae bacterium CG_4_9_14_3_um_filter_53_35]|nr:MAG: histidinol-phosphate transaminase [Nitrospirae bacterium CG2_30_53_67]PIS38144.1 MAG: histidinol-phosphate transaminase [Nitrospirae bacterium CG08_land_8_20_14_0_20_52_24]PIV85084.1 MAG: histidinol-phosphate transaminase [Nitrospirae bacterium CG17_big_fil_post_rev_8_21_14_2_50_50_9]PIX85360.1 MAG: histidinol-phosphate transaminase [Nitrospirae bacterium CG_4_10_14_3_um_filter_53_41]PJA72949.1 MAG: histidinol-phosphate transaminase [Nitrospirae bacterium CG_4_9_14_3_um_filter_53_35]